MGFHMYIGVISARFSIKIMYNPSDYSGMREFLNKS